MMEIKDCYACGGNAEIRYNAAYWVECTDCSTCSSTYGHSDLAIDEWNNTEFLSDQDLTNDHNDAERYRKLRGWMSSNVKEGWCEVEKLAAIACYLSWDDFDANLDQMTDCNVGLMEKRS